MATEKPRRRPKFEAACEKCGYLASGERMCAVQDAFMEHAAYAHPGSRAVIDASALATQPERPQ
jgi:hypothetical protein